MAVGRAAGGGDGRKDRSCGCPLTAPRRTVCNNQLHRNVRVLAVRPLHVAKLVSTLQPHPWGAPREMALQDSIRARVERSEHHGKSTWTHAAQCHSPLTRTPHRSTRAPIPGKVMYCTRTTLAIEVWRVRDRARAIPIHGHLCSLPYSVVCCDLLGSVVEADIYIFKIYDLQVYSHAYVVMLLRIQGQRTLSNAIVRKQK